MNCTYCGARATVYLCPSCGDKLRDMIGQLPWLATQLALTYSRQSNLTPGPTAARQRPATEDDEESPLPYNERARECYDEVRTTVMRWVRDLSEQTGIAYAGADPARVSELSAWLLTYLDRLLSSEDAALALDEFTEATDRGVAAINRPIAPVYRGPCPSVVGTDHRDQPRRCGVPLYAARTENSQGRTVPVDFVTCPRCQTTHDARALEQKLLAELGSYLMPADEILRVMRELGEPIGKSTWHNWRAKGKLQPAAWRHRGRVVNYWLTSNDEKLYRLDDVRALRAAGVAARTPARV